MVLIYFTLEILRALQAHINLLKQERDFLYLNKQIIYKFERAKPRAGR